MEAEIGLDVYICTCKLPNFSKSQAGEFYHQSVRNLSKGAWRFQLHFRVFQKIIVQHFEHFMSSALRCFIQNITITSTFTFKTRVKNITVIITWTLNNYFSLINWFKFTYFLKLWQNCSMDMSRDQDHCSWPLFNLHVS